MSHGPYQTFPEMVEVTVTITRPSWQVAGTFPGFGTAAEGLVCTSPSAPGSRSGFGGSTPRTSDAWMPAPGGKRNNRPFGAGDDARFGDEGAFGSPVVRLSCGR